VLEPKAVNITLPEFALVVLIGPSGAGKSTFARAHFKPTEVLLSDFCRALVSDDENNLAATEDAFAVLHFIVAKRLAAREFALGVEALERFVRREPLRRVHECVFGVLALESEPVDPRL
jgi:protein phosphatase